MAGLSLERLEFVGYLAWTIFGFNFLDSSNILRVAHTNLTDLAFYIATLGIKTTMLPLVALAGRVFNIIGHSVVVAVAVVVEESADVEVMLILHDSGGYTLSPRGCSLTDVGRYPHFAYCLQTDDDVISLRVQLHGPTQFPYVYLMSFAQPIICRSHLLRDIILYLD